MLDGIDAIDLFRTRIYRWSELGDGEGANLIINKGLFETSTFQPSIHMQRYFLEN